MKASQNSPVQIVPILLTQRQAAAYCGQSMTGWHRLKSAGELPRPVRMPLGGRPRYRRSDLDQWVAKLPPE